MPILGVAGDQQAATVGQACFAPGMLKATYGTGCFAVLNTGDTPVASRNRLLTTIAYQLDGRPTYALEGSIFIAGAVVQWLRDGLKIIRHASETHALAEAADPGQRLYLVPAFTGLGAPYWDPDARGAIFGLTRNSGPAEFARAALESVAYQTRDLVEAMRADWPAAGDTVLRVDGGMTANDWVLQGLADTLGAPVDRPKVLETTALGAAWLAGMRAGLYPGPAEFARSWALDRRFEPSDGGGAARGGLRGLARRGAPHADAGARDIGGDMAVKVAINGFGRIGRNVLRAIVESGRDDIEVVAINDLGPVETNAHLMRYDSVHGRFPGTVTVEGDTMDVGRGPMKVTAERDPKALPWGDVDVALECTGIFTDRAKAALHLENGSKRVIVSAPATGADKTIVFGVNDKALTRDDRVISNASCTTNCLAPVAYVLNNAIGIEKGFMTTIHSYTGDQPTLDTLHKDLYRGRAAALSMIPTTTGAAKAVGLVLPELDGKLDGVSIRVPTPNVSVVDFKFLAKRADLASTRSTPRSRRRPRAS